MENINVNKHVNICRFCLVDDGCKDLSTEYYYTGQREVYGEMIHSIFNIELPYLNISCSICNKCIARLHDAKNFRDILLQCQERFSNGLVEVEEYEYKLEEKDHEVFNNYCTVSGQDEACHEDSGDEEFLANIKRDRNSTENNIVDMSITYRKSKAKKKTRDKSYENSKPVKDWSKIAERRGNGPLLRETSLKLIAHSTACVFQWNKSRYRCFCCTEPFSDINLLRDHTESTHTVEHIKKKIVTQQNRLVKVEISTLCCKICGFRLENLTTLREHLKAHDIKFESEEDLLVPFKIDKDLQCQICQLNFSMFRLLNIHMNRHYQKQVCHICGAGFSNLVFLNLHKSRTHREISCKDCKMVFKDKTAKRNHDVTIHKVTIERKRRFPCPYCQERFYQENIRVQHLVDKHGMLKPEHKCNICTKSFITKSLRNNHVKKVHLKEKNSQCDVCHHLFYTKSDVVRHRVTHTGDKKFSCSLCNNLFSTKDSLRRHTKRTHGGVIL